MFCSKDHKHLAHAQAVADIYSKDPRCKVGAVVLGDEPNQLAIGYNGLPPGIPDDERLNDKAWKLEHVLHAEENALANATFPVRTLYVTKPPCKDCALRILAARTVRRVVFYKDDANTSWVDSQNQATGLLLNAGIAVSVIHPS